MQLVLRNAAGKIRVTFTGPDGEALAPTSPTVTIVRDSDGEALYTDAVATIVAEGVVSFTIAADKIPEVDLLRVSWSGTGASAPDQEVEVVGGFLCSLEAIDDDGDPAETRRIREQAELWLEDTCGMAFRPRYQRETITAEGGTDLLLSRPQLRAVVSATVDGEDIDLSDLTLGETVYRAAGWCGEVDIAYEYGYGSTPEPISRAATLLAQHAATGGSDRVTRFAEDQQEFWLTVGGVGGAATSIPEVNAAIDEYGIPSVG